MVETRSDGINFWDVITADSLYQSLREKVNDPTLSSDERMLIFTQQFSRWFDIVRAVDQGKLPETDSESVIRAQ